MTKRTCTADGCERSHLAKGLCSLHYKRKRRAEGKEPNGPWDDGKRERYEMRRAIQRGATIGPSFTRREVFTRDKWTCQICHTPVAPDVKYPDPRSASLDHIIPLSAGGAHSADNTQLAHLVCNTRKGARGHTASPRPGITAHQAHAQAAQTQAQAAAARAALVRDRLVRGTLARLGRPMPTP